MHTPRSRWRDSNLWIADYLMAAVERQVNPDEELSRRLRADDRGRAVANAVPMEGCRAEPRWVDRSGRCVGRWRGLDATSPLIDARIQTGRAY